MAKTLFLLIMAVLAVSCGKPDDNRKDVFVPGFKLLPSAVPVNKGDKVHRTEYVVNGSDENASIRFAVAGNERPYEAYPAVVIEAGDSVKIIELKEFLNYNWVLVGSSEDHRHIWGLLDYGVEGPDESVKLIWSEDGGSAWEYRGLIKKPYFTATADALILKPGGSGTLRMHQDAGAGRPFGYYDYPFRDYGRVWTQPVYRGDVKK